MLCLPLMSIHGRSVHSYFTHFFPTYEVQVVVVVQLEGEGEGEHNLQMATMDQCEFHA